MIPILYDSGELMFDTNGLGGLSDAISCAVTEERNGAFELEMEYPMTGIHYNDIKYDRIVLAAPNPYKDPQPFRIYFISRPIDGAVTIQAEHVSYQLNNIPVMPFKALGIGMALTGIFETYPAVDNPFEFWTSKTGGGGFEVTAPKSARSCLMGDEGSVLDIWGGELEFDKFSVKLHGNRGYDNGVKIVYGKNLIDLKQEENISNVVTGIVPYWQDNDGNAVYLDEKTVQIAHSYAYPHVAAVDFSSDFEEAPTQAQLREKANEYIQQSGIAEPEVSIDIDFVSLGDTLDYPELKGMERVALCDTVTVQFDQLGIDVKAKVSKTVYDVLDEKYTSITVGSISRSISDTIVAQKQEIEQVPDRTALELAIERNSKVITGNKGGNVILYNPSGAKYPTEILIMNTDDVNTATKVWRWNAGGLGYSNVGYNGPFNKIAMTMEGEINAELITVGQLDGAIIKAGTIKADALQALEISADDIKGGTLSGVTVVTSNAIITGGSIKIETDDQNYNYIELKSGTKQVYVSPTFVRLVEGTANDHTSRVGIQNNGIFLGKNPTSNNVEIWTDGTISTQEGITAEGTITTNSGIVCNGVAALNGISCKEKAEFLGEITIDYNGEHYTLDSILSDFQERIEALEGKS